MIIPTVYVMGCWDLFLVGTVVTTQNSFPGGRCKRGGKEDLLLLRKPSGGVVGRAVVGVTNLVTSTQTTFPIEFSLHRPPLIPQEALAASESMASSLCLRLFQCFEFLTLGSSFKVHLPPGYPPYLSWLNTRSWSLGQLPNAKLCSSFLTSWYN